VLSGVGGCLVGLRGVREGLEVFLRPGWCVSRLDLSKGAL